jgi:hypothetical protein
MNTTKTFIYHNSKKEKFYFRLSPGAYFFRYNRHRGWHFVELETAEKYVLYPGWSVEVERV